MPTARSERGDSGYRIYLMDRLKRALLLAENARSERERVAHLRACRHYCAMLGLADD
ncbi:hypothetical protein G7077_03700 [Sphingomonas piscis]|uniref:Uncharacterized protein n=1 Tax=Sphingomonas piscis TaxID=2714943 RepID=A0A6G7YN31_9SPHN|nr:hypothetical protein [Sphingomonas piscis]QIK78148.1 hypothetical protein G7077_03700 [Sphingomonas piscis]